MQKSLFLKSAEEQKRKYKLYFPLFLPLWATYKGKFFLIAPQPYPRALRKSALVPLLHERKHSLWYAHRNDLTAPAHPVTRHFI